MDLDNQWDRLFGLLDRDLGPIIKCHEDVRYHRVHKEFDARPSRVGTGAIGAVVPGAGLEPARSQ